METNIFDLPGLNSLEIAPEGIVALKGSCKAAAWKRRQGYVNIFEYLGIRRID